MALKNFDFRDQTRSKDKIRPETVSSGWRCIPKINARIRVDVRLLRRLNDRYYRASFNNFESAAQTLRQLEPVQ